MNHQITDIDWSLLRSPLLMFVFVVCIAGTLIGGSWYYQKHTQDAQQEAKATLEKMTVEHEKSQQALAVYESFADKFEQLQKHHFLQAEERRNQWIERIPDLAHWQDFFTIAHLQSEPAQNYLVSGVQMEEDFNIRVWKLRLHIYILHMGNLLDFFDHLYARYDDGLYNIQECEMKLKNTVNWQDNIKQAGLEGYCLLQWHTGDIQTRTGE